LYFFLSFLASKNELSLVIKEEFFDDEFIAYQLLKINRLYFVATIDWAQVPFTVLNFRLQQRYPCLTVLTVELLQLLLRLAIIQQAVQQLLQAILLINLVLGDQTNLLSLPQNIFFLCIFDDTLNSFGQLPRCANNRIEVELQLLHFLLLGIVEARDNFKVLLSSADQLLDIWRGSLSHKLHLSDIFANNQQLAFFARLILGGFDLVLPHKLFKRSQMFRALLYDVRIEGIIGLHH